MYKFYNISSPFPRHKKYIKIFNASKNRGIKFEEYIDSITDFVLDKKLSQDNIDDVECFSHLIFDSIFGNLHILYCSNLIGKFENNNLDFDNLVFNLFKYLNYLNKVAGYLVEDLITYIFGFKKYENTKTYNLLYNLLSKLLDFVDSNCKITLVNVLINQKDCVENIPKIKLYAIFS